MALVSMRWELSFSVSRWLDIIITKLRDFPVAVKILNT